MQSVAERIQAFIGGLGGRKFVLCVSAVLVIVGQSTLSLSNDQILAIAGVVCAFVLGQGIADGGSGGLTSWAARIKAIIDLADSQEDGTGQ
ncbi:hypothetical protein HS125_04525 [bacterium]|nr:hypothetical protein [bacterium]